MLSSGLLSMLGSLVSLVGIIGAMLAMNVSRAAHLYRTAYHDSYRRFLAAVRTAFFPAYTRRHLTG